MYIPGLRGLSPKRLIKDTFRLFLSQDMLSYSAAVTYHVLFSALPFLIFFVALLGFLDLSDLFDWLRQRSEELFLHDTVPQINGILDQLQRRRSGMLSFGVIASLWASSSGMRSIMKALNVVYCVREERPLWKRYLLSLLYTPLLGVMIAIAATMVLVAPQAMQALAETIGMEHAFAILWAWWLRWPAVILLLTAAVAIAYGVAPDVEQRIRFVTPGAFLVVVSWIGTSLAFNFYLRNISEVDAVYGSLGTAIVLPLYVYISSMILLFGAEVNAVIERHAPSGKDSGEKRPG